MSDSKPSASFSLPVCKIALGNDTAAIDSHTSLIHHMSNGLVHQSMKVVSIFTYPYPYAGFWRIFTPVFQQELIGAHIKRQQVNKTSSSYSKTSEGMWLFWELNIKPLFNKNKKITSDNIITKQHWISPDTWCHICDLSATVLVSFSLIICVWFRRLRK